MAHRRPLELKPSATGIIGHSTSVGATVRWDGAALGVADHPCLAWKPPGRLADELRRTRHTIEDITGVPVSWFRPPYGVMTGKGFIAARRAGLQTVLWSSWGRDWSRRATPESIAHKVSRVIQPGGTVLLHDSDRTSAPGSWLRTLAASEVLLAGWSARG